DDERGRLHELEAQAAVLVRGPVDDRTLGEDAPRADRAADADPEADPPLEREPDVRDVGIRLDEQRVAADARLEAGAASGARSGRVDLQGGPHGGSVRPSAGLNR